MLTSRKRFGFILMMSLFYIGSALAGPQEDLDASVVQWIGSGTNKAYFVVDFDDMTTQSSEIVFGYRYGDAVATSTVGLEIMEAVADATRLEYVDAGGGFITRITYGPFDGDATQSYPPTWSFFASEDFAQTYSMPFVGIASYEVYPGDVIAYSFTRGEWPGDAPNGPRVSATEFALMEDVVEWTGTGSNHAYFSVDFDDSTTLSAEFVFGVCYGDFVTTSIIAQDLINTVADETVLHYFDAGGGFVQRITYGSYDGDATQSYPPTWALYQSEDNAQNYTLPMEGIATLRLYPGSVVAYSFTTGEWPGLAPNGPRSRKAPKASARLWQSYE